MFIKIFGQMKENPKDSIEQTKKYRSKYNILLLISIVLPLIVLIHTAYAHEKERLFKLFSLKQQNLIEEVQTSLQALQEHIQNSKIQLDYHYTWQRSVEEEVNMKQKENQSAFYKDLRKLQQSKLNYFQFTQSNSSDDHQGQSNEMILEVFDRNQLKEIREIQQLSSLKEEKMWLQAADKIVFSVTLLGINPKSQPVSDQAVGLLQKQIRNQLKINSYLKKVLLNQKKSYQIFLNKNIQIDFVITSAHISQLDQNYRKKLQSIFNHQKSLAYNDKKGQQNQHKDSSEQINFYVQEIFKELQDTNKGDQCRYQRNHTECKEFRLFFLYDNGQELNQVCKFSETNNYDEQGKNSQELQEMQQIINERAQNTGYWSKQDKQMTLITFYPFIQEQQLKTKSQLPQSFSLAQTNHKLLVTLLKQIIYSNLGIAPFILLTGDMWHWDHSDSERGQEIERLITHYIELNLLYKTKSTLQHIHRILKAQSPRYESIPSTTKEAILGLAQAIKSYKPWSDQLINNQIFISNSVTSPIISSITQIDPFPSDYILGALLPIAIILIYPLFGFCKNVFF